MNKCISKNTNEITRKMNGKGTKMQPNPKTRVLYLLEFLKIFNGWILLVSCKYCSIKYPINKKMMRI